VANGDLFFPREADLRREDFDEFARIVYEHSGINLKPGKEALVASRVSKRLRVLRIGSFGEYLEFLRRDTSGQELIHLLDSISTNVTHFFREQHHFEILKDKARQWMAAGQRRFRFWSAASSTGEEPYSMALVLDEVFGTTVTDWKILATDISTRVLTFAQAGVYPEERLEKMPGAYRSAFQCTRDQHGESLYALAEAFRKRVVFKRLNLSSPPFPMSGPLDMVFCRNVMIYFDNQVRRGLIAEIVRLLKPGGILCVGSSESLAGAGSSLRSFGPSAYIKS